MNEKQLAVLKETLASLCHVSAKVEKRGDFVSAHIQLKAITLEAQLKIKQVFLNEVGAKDASMSIFANPNSDSFILYIVASDKNI